MFDEVSLLTTIFIFNPPFDLTQSSKLTFTVIYLKSLQKYTPVLNSVATYYVCGFEKKYAKKEQ